MIIAMRTVLITLFIRRHILPKRLLTLLADERHLRSLSQRVRLGLCVTLSAVIPLLAAWSANGDLCVQDVFTDINFQNCVSAGMSRLELG